MPEERGAISIHDRGFLYGDGLFEAVRIYQGEPFLWNDHIARFQSGCETLLLQSPFSGGEILKLVREVIRRNQLTDAMVRFTLSRGPGPRGYSPRGADTPTFLLTVSPAQPVPHPFRVIIASIRLPGQDPFSGFKHLNKLVQVLARAEADSALAHEALLQNERGFLVEGSSSNLFWIEKGVVCTPPVRGILRGVTRAHVLRLCAELKISTREKQTRPEALLEADGVFVTSCGLEIAEVSSIDGRRTRKSPLVQKLKRSYRHSKTAPILP
ncbi:MAG TPA: aminotransferase class IV [Verrucomicrobiae bacterium]|nr:aminotransferase class IV [Verrucomicrobiae bacterium]